MRTFALMMIVRANDVAFCRTKRAAPEDGPEITEIVNCRVSPQ